MGTQPYLAGDHAFHMVVVVHNNQVAQAQLRKHAVGALQREGLQNGRRAGVHVGPQVYHALGGAAIHVQALRILPLQVQRITPSASIENLPLSSGS